MLIKKILSAVISSALLLSAGGCSLSGNEDDKEIKVFTGFYGTSGIEIAQDNDIMELIAEKTGVKLEQTWLFEQDSANRTFSDMIVSNKYPDYIYADAENCHKLIKEGAFIPIDKYWDDYPLLKSFCKESEWDRIRSEDGHIYYIPLFSSINGKTTETVYSGEAFWIQLKVLKWADYPEIKTLDEYFDLLERYMRYNMYNENGDKNIGYEILATNNTFFAVDNPPMFLDGYPNDGCCIVDPDSLDARDYNLSDTAKLWFKKLNEEYSKGIIDPECFVQNSDQYYQKIASGRVLGMVDQYWNFSQAASDLPPECTYIPLNVTIDESIEGRYRSRNTFNDSTGVGVSVSCSDPDAAVKFMNDLLSPEIELLRFWGIEDVDYTVDENGIFRQSQKQIDRWFSNSYYSYSHICMYNYMPYHMGQAPDKINAYCPSYQEETFFERQPPLVQECFKAYNNKTFVDFMNEPDENPPWFPMWTYSNILTNDTDYGRVMKQIDNEKHRYLPLLVMSGDFDAQWAKYEEAYKQIDTEIYFNELSAEVRRRCGINEKE